MTVTAFRMALVAGFVATSFSPALAQRRELQQMAADIRILQEQTQLLQNALSGLTDALKAVNQRIDEQTAVTRKTFADAKLQADAAGSDIRVVRERVDDTNVRITSLSQEVQSLRDAIAAMPVPTYSTDLGLPGAGGAPGAPGGVAPGDPAAALPPPAGPNTMSPSRLYDLAWADYTAGNYDLAVEGFSSYVRSFPKSEFADNAQYYIGESFYPARQARRGGRCVRARHLDLSHQRRRRPGLLQARNVLRAAEPAGSRARGLRRGHQDARRHRCRASGQAAARRAQPHTATIVGAGSRLDRLSPRGHRHMGSVNKVILVGNLGRDAEVRVTPSGAPVASFSIATTENWTSKDGQKQEQTEWHRIVLWGKMAETLQPYLTKGKQIYLEGRLQTRQWEKEGQKHYTTEVKADKVVLLGGGGRGGDRGDRGDGGGYSEPMGQPAGAITDDDIPF